MEKELSPVKLKLDEENSLTFEVKIEGEVPAFPPIYRLVCEAQDVSYIFRGEIVDDGVCVSVPPMQNKLKEGAYDMHLEVVIENKLLVPLQMQVEFSAPTSIHVENVHVAQKSTRVENKQAASVSAKLKDKEKQQANVVVEQTSVKTHVAEQSVKAQADSVVAKASKEKKKHPTLRELYAKNNKANNG
jgi:hypothetical protein